MALVGLSERVLAAVNQTMELQQVFWWLKKQRLYSVINPCLAPRLTASVRLEAPSLA